MGFINPTLPPYDPVAWGKLPFPERGRQVCESWAMQGYGAPLLIYMVYAAKVAFYIYMWRWFTGPIDWLSPVAFQKAILWSMLFEGVGLGCGSGPLTARYVPPLGGALYWLWPGTIKMPIIGGSKRTIFDVALYVGLIACLLRALFSDVITFEMLLPIVILVPVIGLLDKTIFLALRAEHYWTTIVVFAFAENWIGGSKDVQLALWFFAGVSKLNHHFPSVVGVMMSNHPLLRFGWFRRLFYRSYPTDLRPSTLATWMGHAGTALELGVPLVLFFAEPGPSLLIGMGMMLALHIFITSNVPMGVPIEWNFMVVYGAFALFWAHPEVSPLAVAPWWLAAFLVFMLLVLPIAGNLWPSRISFLLAMRYYAGNWAYSVWLFRGETYRKLAKVPAASPWLYDQLEKLYDPATSRAIGSKVVGFRMMHLHGRALPLLIPKAVADLNDYEYIDGELVAGMMLGWNFGDGHLHNEGLLKSLQERCGFAPGELRCIFVESQPLGKSTMAYRIVDAATGEVERGELSIAEMRSRQPWATA